MSERRIRIIVLGDLLVSPSGDARGLGWLGRVLARTHRDDVTIEAIALPVPNETTAGLAERWWSELERRLGTEEETFLVVALGNTDPAAGISISRSRLNLATILDEARKRQIEPFVIGPVPSRNPEVNADIEHLAWGFEDVATRRSIPFVDCYGPLVEHEGWLAEMAESENGVPGQVGYGLIAWLVLNGGWSQWLGLSETA
jgi:hypothetical protein